MANGNHKEKLAIVCIGIVLLLTILGIVVLIGTGNGKKPDSQDRLQEEILEYAEEYYQNYDMYFHTPNRKGHVPYIFKALIMDAPEAIG
ncbi:MAG: hypothetical protein IKM28_02670, partial [Lachnospiraceae bacterium]|nr:hypothetical protein [Lachnospiraceae bacterium]